jgi:hypothetical protein
MHSLETTHYNRFLRSLRLRKGARKQGIALWRCLNCWKQAETQCFHSILDGVYAVSKYALSTAMIEIVVASKLMITDNVLTSIGSS